MVKIDLRAFGGSALTDEIDVPKPGVVANGIPITYVPARNTIFLSFAMAWAEVLECSDVFIGVNAIDYSGYPDCRPEFIDSVRADGEPGDQGWGGRPHAAADSHAAGALNKAAIVRLGAEAGVDFALTHSCYDPDAGGRPCGRCDSCVLRAKGFAEAGVQDPLAISTLNEDF